MMRSLALVDYVVIGCFMLMLASIGFIFKFLNRNSKDYFAGGHRIAWWMAGCSAFMGSFSAWTFTGAMGIAHAHGVTALIILWANVAFYLIFALFVAARFRQARVVTQLEIYRERFGEGTERFFFILTFLLSFLGPAIALYGLSIFVTPILGIEDPRWVIVGTGIVIMIYSTVGGSWAVNAADFMQALILMPITIVLAVLTLADSAVGGLAGMIEKLPAENLTPVNENYTALWLTVFWIQLTVSGCSTGGRAFVVRDGRAARKMALLAMTLFLVGPLVWFIPGIAGHFLYPDMASIFPGLNKPAEGVYAVMSMRLLPVGVMGLMVAAIFGSTMSTLDTAVNGMAGSFLINCYSSWLRKGAGRIEQMIVSRLATFVFATLVILTAILYTSLKDKGVFEISLMIVPAVVIPCAMPGVLLFIFHRAPWWAALVTMAVSIPLGFVYISGDIPALHGVADRLAGWISQLPLPDGLREAWTTRPWSYPTKILTMLVSTTAVFGLTSLGWRAQSQAARDRIDALYLRMRTPIDVEAELPGGEDLQVLRRTGALSLVVGLAILLLLLVPDYTLRDRLVVIAIAGVTAGLGWLLYHKGRPRRAPLAAASKPMDAEPAADLDA